MTFSEQSDNLTKGHEMNSFKDYALAIAIGIALAAALVQWWSS